MDYETDTIDLSHPTGSKAADPKLRKAIIVNFNQETLKSICELP
jgi:hypothetical protein